MLNKLSKDNFVLISDCLEELITRRREAGININHVQAVMKIFHNSGIMENQELRVRIEDKIRLIGEQIEIAKKEDIQDISDCCMLTRKQEFQQILDNHLVQESGK